MEDEPKRIPLNVPPNPKPPKRLPYVGDMIEWVNLLEVWANDQWVDDGGPYFDIKSWDNTLVRKGIIIEGSIVEDVWYWTVWQWQTGDMFCVSDETDQIRIISSCEDVQDNH
tara:strand:- start:130 stop:465 length:336 start_codon:yes stop_codon:yes gene_type:complete